LIRLISFKLDIVGHYSGSEDSEDPEDASHGLIPAAFGHPTLQRFILKAPYVSFPECNNGLPSSVPISTSLKYVEIPTFSTVFYFIDPLKLLPVVRHIHFGLPVPHRLLHPHKYLRSLILDLYYWPLHATHSFLVQLVALQKLRIYGFAGRTKEKLFDFTCLFPIFSTLRLVDINISIYIQPEDETEQFKQELEQERVRNGWTELYMTSIVRSCTALKGLRKKK
jgi:hypothetical protein